VRRRIALVALAAGLLLAAPAHAAKLVTWTFSSGYVDTSKSPMNMPAGTPKGIRVNVLLPDGYDGKRRFPVLYLLHGHGDNWASWMNPAQGDLVHVAPGLPAIVVMPEGGRGWYTDWWDRSTRQGWEGYFLKELVPMVEGRLKVLPGRRWHAIAGLSMAGEGTMYFASQLPGYFGSAASFSGVLSIQRPEWPMGFDTQGESHTQVYGDPSAQRFYWTGHNPTALAQNLRYTRLYVSVGDGVPAADVDQATNTFGTIAETDLRQHAMDFVSATQGVGASVTYAPHQGIHDWPYWRRDLANAVHWGLFAPVAEAPATWSYLTVERVGDAWGYHFVFSSPPTTVEQIERHGNTLIGTGSGTVRIRTPEGMRFSATMPFEHTVLPAPAAHRRHRRR
jgi:S-formylglutathione hydrolase FrmB